MKAIAKTDKDTQQNQLWKTKLCSFFQQGRCRYGKKCAFAHDPAELASQPDLSKTSLCIAWSAGTCEHSAEECRFAHGNDELRPSLQAKQGDACSIAMAPPVQAMIPGSDQWNMSASGLQPTAPPEEALPLPKRFTLPQGSSVQTEQEHLHFPRHSPQSDPTRVLPHVVFPDVRESAVAPPFAGHAPLDLIQFSHLRSLTQSALDRLTFHHSLASCAEAVGAVEMETQRSELERLLCATLQMHAHFVQLEVPGRSASFAPPRIAKLHM
jgi:hypothetical protein